MNKVLKKTLIEEYRADGWEHQVQIFDLDPTLAEVSYWEVIPEARIYVVGDNEQSEKLAQAFQDVWLSLPPAVCDRLIAYWRASIHGFLPGVPRIEASHDIKSIAITSGGLSFEFNADILDKMPHEILRDVIAHELGHAWNQTFKDSLITTLSYAKNQAAIEWEADLAATYWGEIGRVKFDMNRWRQWAARNNDLMRKLLGHTEEFVLPSLGSLVTKPMDPRARV